MASEAQAGLAPYPGRQGLKPRILCRQPDIKSLPTKAKTRIITCLVLLLALCGLGHAQSLGLAVSALAIYGRVSHAILVAQGSLKFVARVTPEARS